MLQRLLESLEHQRTDNLFTHSVVVADNDYLESAKPVVCDFAAKSSIVTVYCVEPVQNISLARNKALEHASGDFVAFCDDDQFTTKEWLLTLLRACNEYAADGALGPVKPYFELPPPTWILKGKVFERTTYPTGHLIGWQQGRTGNLLFRRGILSQIGAAFRPEFLTGEDQDFFRRVIENGHRFIWCDEAVAYEIVPPQRWKRSFMLRRALQRGKIALLQPTFGHREIAKSMMAVLAYTAALPFGLLAGQHVFMKYLVKMFDHLGRLLAFVGLNPSGNTYVTE